jgi:hypothetical protein
VIPPPPTTIIMLTATKRITRMRIKLMRKRIKRMRTILT